MLWDLFTGEQIRKDGLQGKNEDGMSTGTTYEWREAYCPVNTNRPDHFTLFNSHAIHGVYKRNPFSLCFHFHGRYLRDINITWSEEIKELRGERGREMHAGNVLYSSGILERYIESNTGTHLVWNCATLRPTSLDFFRLGEN